MLKEMAEARTVNKTSKRLDGVLGTRPQYILMLGCILSLMGWICVLVTHVSLDVPTATHIDLVNTGNQTFQLSASYSAKTPHKDIKIFGHIYRFPEGIRFIKTQKKATLSKNDSQTTVRKEYESLVERLGVECSEHERMGSRGDGGWHVCTSPPYNMNPPCLVYDFGIARSWSFDDAITQTHNCTLRAFDPTNGLDEHDRSEKIHFYPIGLSGSVGSHRRFPATTLKALLERFGETRATMDYLKMDIEFSEWDALQTMLVDGSLARVKQIGMEVHVWTTAKASLVKSHIDLLNNMTSAGFRMWRSDWNKHTIHNISDFGQITHCHEIYFLNINVLRMN